MCTANYFLLIACIIVLWIVLKGREMFSVSDPTLIVEDIGTNIHNEGDYNTYKLYGKVPLTPWLYLRCVDLYKQGKLTEEVVRGMLFHSMA